MNSCGVALPVDEEEVEVEAEVVGEEDEDEDAEEQGVVHVVVVLSEAVVSEADVDADADAVDFTTIQWTPTRTLTLVEWKAYLSLHRMACPASKLQRALPPTCDFCEPTQKTPETTTSLTFAPIICQQNITSITQYIFFSESATIYLSKKV